jgi:hypothetical protein
MSLVRFTQASLEYGHFCSFRSLPDRRLDHVASGDPAWRTDERRWTMELVAGVLAIVVLLLVVKTE